MYLWMSRPAFLGGCALPPPPSPASTVFLKRVRIRRRQDRGQRQMERTLEEQRRDRYHDAQPPELECCPCGKLEKEEFARPGGCCSCLPPPERHKTLRPPPPGRQHHTQRQSSAPPRTSTPRKARSTPRPSPPLCRAIWTTPQRAHCRSPTLPLRRRCAPQEAATRPTPPPPSLPFADGGHARHRSFSPPLPAPKHPDNAVARRRRPPSLNDLVGIIGLNVLVQPYIGIIFT